jgi:hypothetical protein
MLQTPAQRSWDHERESALAEELIAHRKEIEARNFALQEGKQLERITLQDLRTRQFFPNWNSYPGVATTLIAQQLMANTIEELLRLGPRASEEEPMPILQHCIEPLNELNALARYIWLTAKVLPHNT